MSYVKDCVFTRKREMFTKQCSSKRVNTNFKVLLKNFKQKKTHLFKIMWPILVDSIANHPFFCLNLKDFRF